MPCRPPAAALCLVLMLGAGLAACADLKEAARLGPKGVDARSPVAPTVAAAAARNYPYPSFRDVPAVPQNVPSAEAYKAAVVDMVGQRRTLKGWAATNPATLSGTAEFADVNRGAIPADALAPPSPQGEATEAFAARMRAQATPPPPPK